jgi:hypothetical protein
MLRFFGEAYKQYMYCYGSLLFDEQALALLLVVAIVPVFSMSKYGFHKPLDFKNGSM